MKLQAPPKALFLTAALMIAACDQADGNLPDGFVYLRDVAPDIVQDVRYATAHNFTGAPIVGYNAAECLLVAEAAEALKAAQEDISKTGFSLKVYDCYRPRRAVEAFVAWAGDSAETSMANEFYPREDKATLIEQGYIADESSHSRGSAIDVTIVPLPIPEQDDFKATENYAPCTSVAGVRFPDNSVDMGTGYDCFDELSHTAHPWITGEAAANRRVLVDLMTEHGFRNFEKEWWHFNLIEEPFPESRFDFPIEAPVTESP